jgi:hypothetical protein
MTFAKQHSSSSTIAVLVLCKDNPAQLDYTLSSLHLLASFQSVHIYILDGSNCPISIDNIRTLSLPSSFCFHYYNLFRMGILGIYPSMNFALCLVDPEITEWLVFMNSGDSFYDKYFFRFSRVYFERGLADVVFAPANNILNGISWLYPNLCFGNITKWLRYTEPCHQAMVVRSAIAKNYTFDVSCSIGADALWKRAILLRHKYVFVPYPLCNFYLDGVSNQYCFPIMLKKLQEPSRRPREKVMEILKYLLSALGIMPQRAYRLKARIVSLLC